MDFHLEGGVHLKKKHPMFPKHPMFEKEQQDGLSPRSWSSSESEATKLKMWFISKEILSPVTIFV